MRNKNSRKILIACSVILVIILCACSAMMCWFATFVAGEVNNSLQEEYCEVLEQFGINNDPFEGVDCKKFK